MRHCGEVGVRQEVGLVLALPEGPTEFSAPCHHFLNTQGFSRLWTRIWMES